MSDDPTTRAKRRLEEHPDPLAEERRTRFYGGQPGSGESVLVDHGGQASEPVPPDGRDPGERPIETSGTERGSGQAAPDQGAGARAEGDPARFTEGVESGEGGDQPVGGSMRPRPDLADEQEERPSGNLGDPTRRTGDAG